MGEQTPNGATGPCKGAVRGPAFGPGLTASRQRYRTVTSARKPPGSGTFRMPPPPGVPRYTQLG
ncbi:hypothetical protein NicSoilC12_31590 [Arthrobacter sp. NicSoilC12]|nr:hypothetical protein NicSoilC12_31590 [Arthrobacter sp. NicSoilC12]